jgi:hypothetical protein
MPIQAGIFLSFYVAMEADLSLLNEATDITTPKSHSHLEEGSGTELMLLSPLRLVGVCPHLMREGP